MNIPKKLKQFGAAAVVATTLATGIGAATTPASAYTAVVGGCYYNCGFTYDSPARFLGASTRSDLGVIGINMYQGMNGPVKVETWVYSWSQRRYVMSGTVTWVNDMRTTAYVSAPYSGIVQLRPGTRGAHSVYLRMTSATGQVLYSNWVSSFENARWQYNGWQVSNSPYAYL